MEDAARLLLMAVVIPLWIAAGLADWACHRATAIERTSGVVENAFHWVLLAEGGVGLLAVALLEPTAGVMLVVFASWLAHEVTTWIELRDTVPRREVRPVEQMIHSFMEILPLVMLVLLAAMRWEQVAALFGQGTPDLGLRWKERPWPAGYLAAAGAAVLVLNVAPRGAEGVRGVRAGRHGGVRR